MTDTFSDQMSEELPLWSDQQPQPVSGMDEAVTNEQDEQWFFQFHENLLLTVQAINRLHEALAVRIV